MMEKHPLNMIPAIKIKLIAKDILNRRQAMPDCLASYFVLVIILLTFHAGYAAYRISANIA